MSYNVGNRIDINITELYNQSTVVHRSALKGSYILLSICPPALIGRDQVSLRGSSSDRCQLDSITCEWTMRDPPHANAQHAKSYIVFDYWHRILIGIDIGCSCTAGGVNLLNYLCESDWLLLQRCGHSPSTKLSWARMYSVLFVAKSSYWPSVSSIRADHCVQR